MRKRPEDNAFRVPREPEPPLSGRTEGSDGLRDGLGLMVRRLPQSALLLDGQRILESNVSAEFVLARSRAELVDQPWMSIFSEAQTEDQDSAVTLRSMMQSSITDRATVPRRWRFRRPDGSTDEWEISLAAVQDGRDLLAVALIRDPSEWTQTALPPGDTFRWEQLGKLSWGIAHDFNNMLTAIEGGLDNALAAGASNAGMRQGLAIARTCTQRAARLNRRLLDLSRDQRFTPSEIAIDAWVQETVESLRPLLGSGIGVVFEPQAGEMSLSGDPEQLDQALVNLALNARDAMPAGGTLHISTAEQIVDADFLKRHPWAKPGRYVRLDVRDSGVGIPYDQQPRVFEPFFTSKAEGRGMGLGLSIVYGIVKQHRGFIDLDSRPGEGTRFWMMFPVRPAESAPQGVGGGGGVAVVEGGAVLVVDDEDVVRDLAVAALCGRGYQVLSAASAEEAEATFADQLDNIDVLVTDLMLSGLGGHELSERFRARKPELQVVFTTGYDVDQLPDGVRPGEDSEFLQKPYTLRALAASVDRMLGRR